MSKFTVTTAIAYVNAKPHIGFAFELLAADVLARYHRLKGVEVRFVTGTDEHGTKIARAAKKAGKQPKEFSAEISQSYCELVNTLSISADEFVRTSEETHKKVAQEIWKRADATGDIYKKKYKGLYCVGCEAFLAPSEIRKADEAGGKAGTCCIHGTKPELVEEENYFFALSRYTSWLKQYLDEHKQFVQPVGRFNEIYALVERGLEDVSISRPKAKLSWGVEVPGDPEHVMYVWFDALTNYLTGCGFLQDTPTFERLWPADVQIIGKEILRFHAALWPAMLKSARLALPHRIYSHGHIRVEGRKMSKSLGNVVDPFAVVNKYGLEAFRYFLLAEIPFADDGNYSESRLVERHNSELANGIGNLVARVTTMTQKFAESKVPQAKPDRHYIEQAEQFIHEYDAAIEELRFHDAISALNRFVTWANQFVDVSKPWILAKSDPKKLASVLRTLLESVKLVGLHLQPIIPATAERIVGVFELERGTLVEQRAGPLHPGSSVARPENLFVKIEAANTP
ncbi:MAG: methionine--tRNA ligase [Parcubacteria group bacterium]